jgi:hypothetical protein
VALAEDQGAGGWRHAVRRPGLDWPALARTRRPCAHLGGVFRGTQVPTPTPVHRLQPFIELGKLVAAALIGALVSAVHEPVSRDRPRSLEQAQVLLCVAGAMMMIIIGNSLARAFGIRGAAGIVRFRTPVDDPKDVTILFLLRGSACRQDWAALRSRDSVPPSSASRFSS